MFYIVTPSRDNCNKPASALRKAVLAIDLSTLCILGLNQCSYNLVQSCLHPAIHHGIPGQHTRIEATGAIPIQRVSECTLVVADGLLY